jgi:hypothetical protein
MTSLREAEVATEVFEAVKDGRVHTKNARKYIELGQSDPDSAMTLLGMLLPFPEVGRGYGSMAEAAELHAALYGD